MADKTSCPGGNSGDMDGAVAFHVRVKRPVPVLTGFRVLPGSGELLRLKRPVPVLTCVTFPCASAGSFISPGFRFYRGYLSVFRFFCLFLSAVRRAARFLLR